MILPTLSTHHQLFNGSASGPARYLPQHPIGSKKYQPSLDHNQGGSQIDYTEKEPITRQCQSETLPRLGVQSQRVNHFEKKP